MNTLARATEIPVAVASSGNNDIKGEVYFDVPADKAYTFKGFNFYTIDIKNTPPARLDAIIKQCEAIEKACWIPQENFSEYAGNKNLLTYIMKDKKIIGFQIMSYWVLGHDFIFDLDETMILKEYRGNGLAFAVSAVSCRTCYLKVLITKHIKKMTFIGLTPNLRLVNIMDKMRHTIRLLDTTFKPSSNLLKIHDYVVEKKGASLVHEGYPFFLKSVFPGSLKASDHTHRTSERIKKMLPPGLDFNGRGDAFLFLASFGKFQMWIFHVALLLKSLGIRIFIDRKLGLLGREKIDHVNRYFSLDEKMN
ncbi:MAG TPA: hypothetical protein PK926_17375 [Spirochaetota bacterium]|nr:hypothetical protein [Spirochaetota bacterium]HPI90316.1 hypothetical protein [Spirochaetota bacterium]HPR49724.1 hypothetical protein [Spirochaetota bacterium]